MASNVLNTVSTLQRKHMLNLTYFYPIMWIGNSQETSQH